MADTARWYVVHTYSGYENTVKATIEKTVQSRQLQNQIIAVNIPQETVNLECMDYEVYVSGKDRSALCNAVNKFVNKLQAAFASGIVGIVLTAIGYQVDSATDTYLGELSAIPNLLTWFIVIMGLIPGVLGVIAWIILGKYPINDEIREKMKALIKK